MNSVPIVDVREQPFAFFGNAALACFTYALLALVVVHVLRPDYAVARHMISDYAVGPHGWIMTTCFIAMSAGCLMLALGLGRSGLVSPGARAGIVLLGVAAAGLIVSAMFPTDVHAPATRSGHIHFLSFVVNVFAILFAVLLVSASFATNSRWRTYRRMAVTVASGVVLTFILQVLTIVWRTGYGYANAAFVVALFVWLIATSLRIRALSRAPDDVAGR